VTFAARTWSGALFLSFTMACLAQKDDTAGRSTLAGSLACANCHEREYASQINTSMAHAMEPVSGCSILRQNPLLTFREGNYSYRIERQMNKSFYTVTDGKDTLRVPLEYAFGLGKAGQTYIFERDGKMYESRVSFYSTMNGLDLTMGAQNLRPKNLAEAAGRLMDRRSTEACFGCHTTSASRADLHQPASLTPGVTCERCHGSALAHVEGFRQRRPVEMKKLSQLSTEELSDFCGQCHRTWAQIAADGPHDINNVRFQPYRLANSKCYDPSDRRISCAACHDVHHEVVTSDSFYDPKCLTCHATEHVGPVKPVAKSCPVARQNCVTCHMPKLELPGSHYKFTDHRIRIVTADAAYPP
jgi:Cytochrome c554 and c-prime